MSLTDPIEIIRGILERVKARRAAETSSDDQERQDQAQAAGAELIPDYKGKEIYISFDGDDIGNAIARAEETDDEVKLAEMSDKINRGQQLFTDFLIQHQGKLIEAGGDEGLGRCSSNSLVDIEDFRSKYQETVGATVTIGIGEKISEATKARMLGKLRGKNQVAYYDGATDQELEIRMAEGSEEAQKLGRGGLAGQQSQQTLVTPKFGVPSGEGDWNQDYELDQEDERPDQKEPEPDDQEERTPESKHERPEPKRPDKKDEKDLDESNDEPYDYTDLPFDIRRDARHHRRAQKIAREDGADPRFLHLVARHFLKG